MMDFTLFVGLFIVFIVTIRLLIKVLGQIDKMRANNQQEINESFHPYCSPTVPKMPDVSFMSLEEKKQKILDYIEEVVKNLKFKNIPPIEISRVQWDGDDLFFRYHLHYWETAGPGNIDKIVYMGLLNKLVKLHTKAEKQKAKLDEKYSKALKNANRNYITKRATYSYKR